MRYHAKISAMSGRIGWAVLGIGCWALLAACGGSSSGGGADCSNTSACGGDLVGSWKVTSSCLTIDTSSMMPSSECPGQTTNVSDIGVSGNFTFNADQTFSSTGTASGKVNVTRPASCMTRNGVTITCAQLQQGIEANLDSQFSSASCTDQLGGGCSCTFVIAPTTTTSSGTYTTADGVLTQMRFGSAPSSSDYCVEGSTMTVSPHTDSSMPSMENATGSITLVKL
jgi:hypothetical protein